MKSACKILALLAMVAGAVNLANAAWFKSQMLVGDWMLPELDARFGLGWWTLGVRRFGLWLIVGCIYGGTVYLLCRWSFRFFGDGISVQPLHVGVLTAWIIISGSLVGACDFIMNRPFM